MPRMICLYTLRPAAVQEEWERFVRDVDIPLTFELPSVTDYSVCRVADELGGSTGFQYVEIVDFKSREALEQDMRGELWSKGVQAMMDNGLEHEVCLMLDDPVE